MKFYTVDDIAEIYNVRRARVRKWIRKGFFPNVCKKSEEGTPEWLIPDTDLQNFKPEKKGRPLIESPTGHAITYRYYRARQSLKKSHDYGEQEFLEMIRLEQEGLSSKEIAERFDVKERFVEDILRRAEIKPLRVKKKKEKKEPKRFPKELLIDLYVEKKLPTAEILECLNTNYASLYINLRHWEIPLRDRNAGKLARENNKLLRRLYIKEDLSFEEIARRLGQTVPYIRRKLRQSGIIKPSAKQ